MEPGAPAAQRSVIKLGGGKASFLTALKHREPTSLAHRIVFILVATFLLLAEVVPLLFGFSTDKTLQIVVWSLLLCGVLATAGFFPVVGSMGYLALATLASIDSTPVAAPMVGTYLVLAYWISRGWYWPSLVGLVLVGATESLFSSTPLPTITGIAFGSAIAVVSGMLLRFYRRKLAAEQFHSLKLEDAVIRASENAREELAAMLHDSVVRDLTRIALMSRAELKESRDVEKWQLVEQLCLEAMETLRELPTSTNENQVGGGQSTAEALNECRAILSQADITLDVEDTYICRLKLDSDIQRIVNMALLEGSTNALKYAPARSVVELQASESDGELSVVLINEMAAGAGPEPLSGHFGLRNLTAEIERKGGSLHGWDAGHKWFMALSLPVSIGRNQNA